MHPAASGHHKLSPTVLAPMQTHPYHSALFASHRAWGQSWPNCKKTRFPRFGRRWSDSAILWPPSSATAMIARTPNANCGSWKLNSTPTKTGSRGAIILRQMSRPTGQAAPGELIRPANIHSLERVLHLPLPSFSLGQAPVIGAHAPPVGRRRAGERDRGALPAQPREHRPHLLLGGGGHLFRHHASRFRAG